MSKYIPLALGFTGMYAVIYSAYLTSLQRMVNIILDAF